MTVEPANDFDILLASNASLDTFPENKPGIFKNKLGETIKLVEYDWKVALSEIYYPNNFQTPVPCDFSVALIFKLPRLTSEPFRRTLAIPCREGHMDFEAFISDFNRLVCAIENEFIVDFTEGSELLRFKVRDKRFDISTSWKYGVEIEIENQNTKNYFSYIGFDDMKFTEGNSEQSRTKLEPRWFKPTRKAPFSIEDHPALFIYCDKLEYQLVGDTRAPLLATIPVYPCVKRPLVFEAPIRLSYAPVRKGYINDIEISILDDTGKQIIFKEGKIFLKLHFRRIPKIT